jgi:hypothetical protein
MGPAGAALINVLYDKIVLGQDMSEEDMLKSFAVGAVAGYAAQGVQGLVEAKEAVDVLKHTSYMSKMASSMTYNLTKNLGDATINGEDIDEDTLLTSVLTALASVEVGSGFGDQVLESTVEGALKDVARQSVETDFTASKIDMDQVLEQTYQGFASGLTTQAVHHVLDATIVPHLPQDLDQKAFDSFKSAAGKFFVHFSEAQAREQRRQAVDAWFDLSEDERRILISAVENQNAELQERAALNAFGKSYSELTSEELQSPQFKSSYVQQAGEHLEYVLNTDPQLAEAATVLTAGTTLTVIQGGAGAAVGTTAATSAGAAALLTGGLATTAVVVGYIIYRLVDNQTSDYSHTLLLRPNPDDQYSMRLYARAEMGDMDAARELINWQIVLDTPLALPPPPLDPNDLDAVSLYNRAKQGDTQALKEYRLLKFEQDMQSRRAAEVKRYGDEDLPSDLLDTAQRIVGKADFKLAPRVLDQLKDSRLGSLAGKLDASELNKMIHNPSAQRVLDSKTGHINVFQNVDGKIIRITATRDEFKIISVGVIRENGLKNGLEKGRFIPIPEH